MIGTNIIHKWGLSSRGRENLNSREGQPDSTPVDKYEFTWILKLIDVTLNFNYRGPLQRACICEYRGSR